MAISYKKVTAESVGAVSKTVTCNFVTNIFLYSNIYIKMMLSLTALYIHNPTTQQHLFKTRSLPRIMRKKVTTLILVDLRLVLQRLGVTFLKNSFGYTFVLKH